MTMLRAILVIAWLVFVISPTCADENSFAITLDLSQVPKLKEWGESARDEAISWYPRIENLLSTRGVAPPRQAELIIRDSDKGVAATAGTTIYVSSHWIEKHPDDIGAVIHELVHVVQSYPNGQPGWITEGIADYIRWVIYEGKPQSWFPKPDADDGYKKGYRVAAGFLFWLESDKAPGIVRRLNSAMRKQSYQEQLFREQTGHSLPELWRMYRQDE